MKKRRFWGKLGAKRAAGLDLGAPSPVDVYTLQMSWFFQPSIFREIEKAQACLTEGKELYLSHDFADAGLALSSACEVL